MQMLAEMEAVKEEEQREEERMGIKDIADLAESCADSETDTQYGKEGMVRDKDIIMADGEDHNDAFVEVDSEPELEGPNTMKTVVNDMMQPEDNEVLLTTSVGVLFNRRGKLLSLGGTFEQQSTRRRKSPIRNQGCSFSFVSYLLTKFLSMINNSAKSGDNLRVSKVTKSTKKFPTGLVTDWRSKASKTSHVTPHQHANSPFGGLADDDAYGE